MNVRIRDAKPSDQEFLARGNEAMALETEHKRLDPVTIRRGVASALANPAHGRYFVAECGISSDGDQSIFWIGTTGGAARRAGSAPCRRGQPRTGGAHGTAEVHGGSVYV